MVMDNDAQKLIAISLGKIATSRCQRGGPSLHRSLLVASVLYKARTTYVDDVFPAFGLPSDSGPCLENNDDNDDGGGSTEGNQSAEAVSEARPSRPMTSTWPLTSAYEDCDSTDGNELSDDKENVQPNDRLSPEPPARCAKRRRTLEEEDCAKRCKRDTALWRRSSSLCSADSEADSDPEPADPEPHDGDEAAMEVESISNLVLAFNSGLKGLSWDAEDAAALDEHGLAPLRRGVSLPDLCGQHRTPSFPVAVLAV